MKKQARVDAKVVSAETPLVVPALVFHFPFLLKVVQCTYHIGLCQILVIIIEQLANAFVAHDMPTAFITGVKGLRTFGASTVSMKFSSSESSFFSYANHQCTRDLVQLKTL